MNGVIFMTRVLIISSAVMNDELERAGEITDQGKMKMAASWRDKDHISERFKENFEELPKN